MQKSARTFAAIFAAAVVLTCTAFADMGPKDSLTVYVENPPAGTYYLDLLYQSDAETLYSNLENDNASYDSELVSMLSQCEDDGWYPAYAGGTPAPMWGSLVGEKLDDGRMAHYFDYFGVPETYRIIIVTDSGESYVSDTYTRIALQSSITLDWETKAVTRPPYFMQYIVQFISTCVPTLIIEFLVLLIFGYLRKTVNRRKNLCVFLLSNLATQAALTATLGTMLIQSGTIGVMFMFIPAEIAVAAVEAAVYCAFLDGGGKRRAILYAVAANALSCAFGLHSVYKVFLLVTSVMT